MKKHLSSFTLVELLIVIAIMGILTGVGSKLWIQMEKNAKISSRNLVFMAQNHIILERLTRDIRRAVQVSQSGNILLSLTQITPQGDSLEMSYRLENNELVREVRLPQKQVKSIKIASLVGTQLGLRLLENGAVRLELFRNAKDSPMEAQTRRVVSIVQPLGKKL